MTAPHMKLFPGEVVLASTLEYVKIPRRVACDLKLKSTLGRFWINHSLAGWCDPGFEGNITLELQNLGPTPFILDAGRRIAQLIFIGMESEPEIAYGLVKVESRFKHRAVSHVGARGLTQVMPATARWLEPGITNEDLFDRHTNLRLGFGYLRDLIEKYDGNIRLALLAYNRGPGTVDRVLRQGGDPNNGYADMVLEG